MKTLYSKPNNITISNNNIQHTTTYMIKTLINDGINNEMWFTLLCGSFTSVITTFIFLALHVESNLQAQTSKQPCNNNNKFENI